MLTLFICLIYFFVWRLLNLLFNLCSLLCLCPFSFFNEYFCFKEASSFFILQAAIFTARNFNSSAISLGHFSSVPRYFFVTLLINEQSTKILVVYSNILPNTLIKRNFSAQLFPHITPVAFFQTTNLALVTTRYIHSPDCKYHEKRNRKNEIISNPSSHRERLLE